MTGIPEFKFNGQIRHYRGKVRDVYYLENDLLVMVVSDRISAFDVVLPKPIPYKGQVLNQLAAKFLDLTSDIIPNWKLGTPDPSVTIGKLCDPFPVEMVIRGYLAGHAWRVYRDGKREICGVTLPDGLKENDKLPEPIITPTTKAHEGHDEDISREEILEKGLVSESDYRELEKATRALFERGSDHAQKQGLILVDTKYEFGKDKNGTITLIDEIHTPDSSRYFYADGYEERQQKGESQKQLSKEFVRKWLIDNNFQGRDGDRMPEMTPEYIESVSERYIELFEKVSGDQFKRADNENRKQRIEKNVRKWLEENS
ncbi:phosphoribosylaminoimidazolesuccinocarboxamide synthase [Salibacter halophilus]|uniref:Phosphoribosylaminoimidazole-succinocarboxamide synthase n=1 Tax=Salibacter halophilus TaxID=1803916 RepID=A0A6N6M7N0_9FLAO|nr:phosphoribosylaminoimidazolesuccinocarboxamide synthase [Salibacter halophilus]KAB1066088.1 phosphoribosylaminoimidazolesuccinocarboxamide synthase [Salibacter halophilus]